MGSQRHLDLYLAVGGESFTAGGAWKDYILQSQQLMEGLHEGGGTTEGWGEEVADQYIHQELASTLDMYGLGWGWRTLQKKKKKV